MKKQAILFGTLALLWGQAPAQTDTLHIPSMEEVYRQNHWLTDRTPVGQSFNRFDSFSIAEAGYSHQKGNLGNEALPASANTYSIYSESFQKVGKVALYGKLGYKLNQRNNLSWSNMSNHYWQALNLCDSINGNQQSEEYQLSGACSLPVHPHWFVGIRFDYNVLQTSKDTDPRNKNQWADWQLTPGVAYQGKNFRLGASLSYAATKETVEFNTLGSASTVTYPVLVSYPVGFFKTLSRDELVNWHYSGQTAGSVLQAEFTHRSWQLFQQLCGNFTQQSVESDRIKSREEAATNRWQIVYQGVLRKEFTYKRHEWEWQATLNKADNYEPLQQQQPSGIWQTVGKTLRSAHNDSRYNLTYGYYRLRDAWHPLYSIVSGVELYVMKDRLFFHPAEFAQPTHRFTVHSCFTRKFLLPKSMWDITLGGEYGKGGGKLMEEKQLSAEESTPDIKLWQESDRLQQDYLYKTSSRWKAQSSVTYTRTVNARWFVRLSGAYIRQNSYSHKEIGILLGLLF